MLGIPISFNFYRNMSIPQTLVTGTFAYLILGVIGLVVVLMMRGVGKLNKDDAA